MIVVGYAALSDFSVRCRMSPLAVPACPACKRTDCETISSEPQYRLNDRDKKRPYETLYVFKCQCGMAFTRSEPIESGHLAQQPMA
jgi:hypothetical protein